MPGLLTHHEDSSVRLRQPTRSACWTVAICVLAWNCGTSGKPLNLHDRIVAARTSQYCRAPDSCYNPIVLALETGYFVTTFVGSKPQHANVPSMGLAKYLESLPMQGWPRGPSIELTQTDDVSNAPTLYRSFSSAQQICRSMGLEVQVRPGG
jgi:hypothetical protein